VVGAAAGDALGAPFEFGPAGVFSAKYPVGEPVDSEMRGGGGWDPGEATDDTQMGGAPCP
jgi:ADP-ribosylglycohydrolase